MEFVRVKPPSEHVWQRFASSVFYLSGDPGDPELYPKLEARLKELEARRIVARHVEAGPPVRVQYTLTRTGMAFEQVAAAIERWGRELVADEPKVPGSRTKA